MSTAQVIFELGLDSTSPTSWKLSRARKLNRLRLGPTPFSAMHLWHQFPLAKHQFQVSFWAVSLYYLNLYILPFGFCLSKIVSALGYCCIISHQRGDLNICSVTLSNLIYIPEADEPSLTLSLSCDSTLNALCCLCHKWAYKLFLSVISE